MTTVNQQKASIGVFVCFEEHITKGMRLEAKGQGYLDEGTITDKCDKMQILSVEELMDGKNIKLPLVQRTTLKLDKADRQESFL